MVVFFFVECLHHLTPIFIRPLFQFPTLNVIASKHIQLLSQE